MEQMTPEYLKRNFTDKEIYLYYHLLAEAVKPASYKIDSESVEEMKVFIDLEKRYKAKTEPANQHKDFAFIPLIIHAIESKVLENRLFRLSFPFLQTDIDLVSELLRYREQHFSRETPKASPEAVRELRAGFTKKERIIYARIHSQRISNKTLIKSGYEKASIEKVRLYLRLQKQLKKQIEKEKSQKT